MTAVAAAKGAGNLDIPDRVVVALRSVNVTRAFDPNRPAPDCDEIFRPSMGSFSAGAAVSTVSAGVAEAIPCE